MRVLEEVADTGHEELDTGRAELGNRNEGRRQTKGKREGVVVTVYKRDGVVGGGAREGRKRRTMVCTTGMNEPVLPKKALA